MAKPHAVRSRIAAYVTMLLATLAVSNARAEVHRLTVGIDTNCPYGLSE